LIDHVTDRGSGDLTVLPAKLLRMDPGGSLKR
jgi:hypothetical protein